MGIFSWIKKQFTPPTRGETVPIPEYVGPSVNDRLPDVVYAGLHESTKDKEAIEVGEPKFSEDAFIAVEPPITEVDWGNAERNQPVLDPVAAGAVEKPKKRKAKAKPKKPKKKSTRSPSAP